MTFLMSMLLSHLLGFWDQDLGRIGLNLDASLLLNPDDNVDNVDHLE
jgi:hypothetical protein